MLKHVQTDNYFKNKIYYIIYKYIVLIIMVEEDRWTCKFCHKSFSPNYKFKNHLSRCLVHTEKSEKEYDVMLELKEELKQELRATFMEMLNEIKADIKHTVNQQQPQQQQYQPRRLITAF